MQLLNLGGADVQASGDMGRTPLHYAAIHGSYRSAEILARTADLDKVDDLGFTPVFAALRSSEPGSQRVAKMSIKLGAAVDINSAVCLGDVKRVRELLLEHSADVNGDRLSGWPPLFEAVQIDDTTIAQWLIAKGADVNHRPAGSI